MRARYVCCPVCGSFVATNKDPHPGKALYPGTYRVMRRHGSPECRGTGMRVLSARTMERAPQ